MPTAVRNKAEPAEDVATGKVMKSGGLRDDLKRFTRERILSAALASFQEIGFKETTVERIVELAGTTAPTFYRHFGGKDGLLPSLQDHLGGVVQACLGRMTAEHVANAKALEDWIGDYLRMWGEVHRLCKAFWDGASLEEDMQPSTFSRMFDTGDTIERLFPDASAKEREERHLRLGLAMLMLDRLAYLVSVSPDETTAQRLIATFSDMMWHSAFAELD